MGNTVQHELTTKSIEEHNEHVKLECKNNLKNRSVLVTILKREWIGISVKWHDKKFTHHNFTSFGYVVDALNIQELTEEYTNLLTKFNCGNLSDIEIDNFTEFIVQTIL